jgi:hypothetical protein
VSLAPKNFDDLGVAAAKISRALSHRRPDGLALLPKNTCFRPDTKETLI